MLEHIINMMAKFQVMHADFVKWDIIKIMKGKVFVTNVIQDHVIFKFKDKQNTIRHIIVYLKFINN